MTLNDLAAKYHCEKLERHSYIPMYAEYFHGRDIRRLLEIGVGWVDLMAPLVSKYIHGASLLMWRDYLPDAEIYSVDIREDALFQAERIHTMQCDVNLEPELDNMWTAFGGNFDVVIDDGDHETSSQYTTATRILPKMRHGDLYIIEDVRPAAETLFFALLPIVRKLSTAPEPIQVHQFGRTPDDNMIVVQL
jgi:hypothetical protein